MTERPKVKRTVTLDADLVEFVGDGNLSAEVNEALTRHLARRRQLVAMRAHLEEIAADEGPLDEDEVQKWMAFLDGGPDPR